MELFFIQLFNDFKIAGSTVIKYFKNIWIGRLIQNAQNCLVVNKSVTTRLEREMWGFWLEQ